MNYAGILAGGIGSRMESSVPKQFLKIADIPIVVRTLRTFLESSDIDKVISHVYNPPPALRRCRHSPRHILSPLGRLPEEVREYIFRVS